MAKKKSSKKTTTKAQTKGLPKIGRVSTRHDRKNYRDLKREAVIRGMPFPDVVEADFNRLYSFIDNSDNKPDISLIDKFDDWVDIQLENAGYPKGCSVRSPRLRLGFLGDEVEVGKRVSKRVPGIPKPKKEKRAKDENGLFRGTKKSYTYELTKRGYTLDRVIRRVKKKFPDASDKSINIWFRNCAKDNNLNIEKKPDGRKKENQKEKGATKKKKADASDKRISKRK
jgi:hypothetical protein